MMYCSGCTTITVCPRFVNSRKEFFFLIIRRPPRSTQSRSSAASDVYKRQGDGRVDETDTELCCRFGELLGHLGRVGSVIDQHLSLIHISEPTRLLSISYAVFCLKKKNRFRCDSPPDKLLSVLFKLHKSKPTYITLSLLNISDPTIPY